MVVQNDKDFAALPEVAKLYQACKERDLTIAEREYLKGARDAWQSDKAQAVPEGFVLVDKHQLAQLMANMDSFGKKALGDDYVSFADIAAVLDEAQEPTND
ncbi:MAG: hypothetical protein L0G96_20570 [Acinetobacter sp.]|nr:hypothetical protein [Acinetobacter sp.]